MTTLPTAKIDLSPDGVPRSRTIVKRSSRVRPTEATPGQDGSLAICEVASESKPDKWYTVYEQRDQTLFCTCPDFLFRRRARGEQCKHLIGLRAQGLLHTAELAARARATTDLSLPRFLILDIPEVPHAAPADHGDDHAGRPRHRQRPRRERPVV